jgi:hypothetical protein
MPRRPIPALVALAALLVLTGLVWWRVLNRSSADSASSCPSPTPTVAMTVLPAPSSVTVQVLNATTHAGIATTTRTTLAGFGFLVPGLATNDKGNLNKIKGVAQIRYGPSSKDGATLLSYYFPGATLIPTASSSSTVLLSLGNAYQAVATPAAVALAMQAAHVETAVSASTGPTSGASPTC